MHSQDTEDQEYFEGLARRFEESGGDFFDEQEYEDLVDYLDSRMEFVKALAVSDKALEKYPFNGVFFIRKAELMVSINQPLSALELLNEAEKYERGATELFLARADALMALKRFPEALDVLQNALHKANPEDWEQLMLAKADVYEEMADHDNLLMTFQRVLHASPRNEEALNRLLWWAESTGRFTECLELSRKITDKDPYCTGGWFNMGFCLNRLEQYEEAIDALEYAIAIDDTFLPAYKECAEAHFLTGQYRRALECMQEAKEHQQLDADSLVILGRCHEALGNPSKAREYYHSALKLHGPNALAHYHLGISYAEEGRWKEALAEHRKSIKLDETYSDALLGAAECCYHLEEYDKVYEYCAQAVALEPEYGLTWAHYSTYMIMMRDYEKAWETAIQGMAAAGEEGSLLYCQAVALILGGRRQEGLLTLRRALEVTPQMSREIFNLSPDLLNDQDVVNLVQEYERKL